MKRLIRFCLVSGAATALTGSLPASAASHFGQPGLPIPSFADYQGTPAQTSLVNPLPLGGYKPNSQGNYFDMTVQTAKNVSLAERLPKNWTSRGDRPLFYKGPFPALVSARSTILLHGGATHIHSQEAANSLHLAATNRAVFWDNLFTMAPEAAAALPANDPRRAKLLEYAASHANLADVDAARYLGGFVYERILRDTGGVGIEIISFDLEAGETPQAQSAMYEGAVQKAASHGKKVIPFAYGGFNLAGPTIYDQNGDNGDAYFRIPDGAWRQGDHIDFSLPLTEFFRTNGGYVGRDQYLRATWDNETVWMQKPDGSIATDNAGQPLFRYGARTITNYGATAPTYPDEALMFVRECYEQAEFVLANWRWYCNTRTDYKGDQSNVAQLPYPKGPGDIRPGLEKLKLNSFFRNDTESIGPMYDTHTGTATPIKINPVLGNETANRRPCNPDAVESAFLLRTIAFHGNMIWTDPFGAGTDFDWGKPRGTIDMTYANGSKTAPNAVAAGQFETMLKARYRAMNFQGFYDAMNAGKIDFVIPKRFILNKNKAIGEREVDKPVLWGFKEKDGRKFWLYYWWPAQDVHNPSQERTVKMWLINGPGGKASGSYTFLCKDRKAGWQEITLPAGFEKAGLSDFRFQWKGLLGDTYSASGAYTLPVTGNPVPPEGI